MSTFSDWKQHTDPEGYRARVAERHGELEQHIQQYLASGGQIQRVPTGATGLAYTIQISTDVRRRSQRGNKNQQMARDADRRLRLLLAPPKTDDAGKPWPTDRVAAELSGALYYDTGRPCRNGHTALRLASTGHCRACRMVEDEARRKWRRVGGGRQE